jgi:hypothetical protein
LIGLIPIVSRAASDELDALLAQIALTPPVSVAFEEVRVSHLLDEALILSGRLHHPSTDTWVRDVAAPWHETTTIDGESVRIERDGEEARTFALARAPDLRAVTASFGAVLAGERSQLDATFDATLAPAEDGSWLLRLAPRGAKLKRRLALIVVSGTGSTVQCFAFLERDGDQSLIMLGPHPDSSPQDVSAAREHCRVPRE